jgi:hypothetical protein
VNKGAAAIRLVRIPPNFSQPDKLSSYQISTAPFMAAKEPVKAAAALPTSERRTPQSLPFLISSLITLFVSFKTLLYASSALVTSDVASSSSSAALIYSLTA